MPQITEGEKQIESQKLAANWNRFVEHWAEFVEAFGEYHETIGEFPNPILHLAMEATAMTMAGLAETLFRICAEPGGFSKEWVSIGDLLDNVREREEESRLN